MGVLVSLESGVALRQPNGMATEELYKETVVPVPEIASINIQMVASLIHRHWEVDFDNVMFLISSYWLMVSYLYFGNWNWGLGCWNLQKLRSHNSQYSNYTLNLAPNCPQNLCLWCKENGTTWVFLPIGWDLLAEGWQSRPREDFAAHYFFSLDTVATLLLIGLFSLHHRLSLMWLVY